MCNMRKSEINWHDVIKMHLMTDWRTTIACGTNSLTKMERGGSVVERRTGDRMVLGSNPTEAA